MLRGCSGGCGCGVMCWWLGKMLCCIALLNHCSQNPLNRMSNLGVFPLAVLGGLVQAEPFLPKLQVPTGSAQSNCFGRNGSIRLAGLLDCPSQCPSCHEKVAVYMYT